MTTFSEMAKPAFPPLETTSLREFYGKPVPERKWLVQGVFPRNAVSILSGPGGVGKSALLYQLCIASALGTSWCGREVERCRSLYVTSEDDSDELHIRGYEMASAMSANLYDLEDVHVKPMLGEDSILGQIDHRIGKINPTLFWSSLWTTLRQEYFDLLILDNVADLFGGNENDRVQVKAFVKLLARYCQDHSCTVILIAHPSVSGMADGSGRSGSTGWANAVRSFWYLKRPDEKSADRDIRELVNQKANRGPDGETIVLRRSGGIFKLEGGGSFIDIAAHRAKVRNVFLSIYRKKRDLGIELTSTDSRSGAVTVFAKDPEAGGIRRHEFEGALAELINDGTLSIVEKGPPSKRRKVIVWPEETNC